MGREAKARANARRDEQAGARTRDPARSQSDCPDFDLAPLIEFPPTVFSREGSAAADAFVLALALAFNDMKGVQWLIRQLEKCKPNESSVTAKVGQWNGMRIQTTRLTLLILHELLKAIHIADRDGVLGDADFVEAVRRLQEINKKDWADLIALAREAPGDSAVRRYIERMRHNFAAHYYQPSSLIGGYRQFFFENERESFNEHALVSFGDSVENTRFYFADAAVQMGQKLLDPSDAQITEVHSYTLSMFQGLRFLIENYLSIKQARLSRGDADGSDSGSAR
jgi:hypothetical protein